MISNDCLTKLCSEILHLSQNTGGDEIPVSNLLTVSENALCHPHNFDKSQNFGNNSINPFRPAGSLHFPLGAMVTKNQTRRDGSDLSQIVAVAIGLFVLLALGVLFLRRKPTVEAKLQDMQSELRDEDEMFHILADGQRALKDNEETDGQKDQRSFLSKLLRLLMRVFLGGCLIIVLSVVTSAGCCVLCLQCPDWFMAGCCGIPRPGCLHGVILWAVKMIWYGSLLITAPVLDTLARYMGW